MAYGVSLWFDEVSERRVRNLWRRLAEVGVAHSFADGLVRPHLTLSHAAELDLSRFEGALAPLLRRCPAFELTFSGLGLFINQTGVLYLTTVFTDELSALQRGVFECVSAHGALSSPYYRPNGWTPHCTLAVKLSSEATLDAVRVAQRFTFPLEVKATRVGVVENPSELELRAFTLGSSNARC